MELKVPYKFLDITPSPELLNFDWSSLTPEDWDATIGPKGFEPDIFTTLKNYVVIGLKASSWYNEDEIFSESQNEVVDNHPIHDLIMNEIRKLEEYYNAVAKIVVLDGLLPGARINRHFDRSTIFSLAHRVHLPLVTSHDVDFYIDDVKYNFPKGKFFEFNNKMYHEVHNNSDIFRIHLVVDLIPRRG